MSYIGNNKTKHRDFYEVRIPSVNGACFDGEFHRMSGITSTVLPSMRIWLKMVKTRNCFYQVLNTLIVFSYKNHTIVS